MPREDLLDIILQTKNNSNKNLNLSINGITEEDLDDIIIEELKYFTEIDLSGNMLKKLPTNFKLLIQLKKITLATNYIKDFPKEITYLVNLETLDLRDNEFSTIYSDIKKLIKLKNFYLKGNPLKKIPKVIFELKSIEVLGLVNTQISIIPKEISNLQNLVSLWIGKNRIKKLPRELIELKSLRQITLDQNPLPIPQSILNYTKDTKDIFSYYIQYEENMLEHTYESKIIIIGESQAGKTSLLNRLIYNRFYNDELKTENINIDDWNIHLKDKIVTSNIWDFGGQDILYSLHKFFLTDNCIYIVVWDARNENQSKKIEKWLRTIKNISSNPKILLVMNKVDEQNTSIDKIYFDKIISNIKYFNISCKNNWNIDKIENEIKNILENNEELIFKYNTKFLKIKKILKQKKESYISIENFNQIIYQNNLTLEEKNELLSTFKQLGLVLYYEKNFRLKNLLLLNTNWFIDGIYSVINWVSKNRINGDFNFNDLEQIFSETNFQYTHEIMAFIIEALLYFNIIFEINHTFYIPNLLKYFNKDIEQITNNNFAKFKINIEQIEVDFFYELLVKYVKTRSNVKFWKNLIHIEYKNTKVYIYLNQKEKIFVYIDKINKDSITNIIEFIIEDFKLILNQVNIDMNIILSDNSQVSISYLRYLQKNGYNNYISSRYNKYSIDKIFGESKIDRIPSSLTNIYIDNLDGDILGDNAKKEIR